MIWYAPRRAALNRFHLTTAGMVTVKLRTFGFLAVVLVGLLFSSCAAFHRRAAISGLAPAGAAELKLRKLSSEMRTSLASTDASDIYHYSFDRQ